MRCSVADPENFRLKQQHRPRYLVTEAREPPSNGQQCPGRGPWRVWSLDEAGGPVLTPGPTKEAAKAAGQGSLASEAEGPVHVGEADRPVACPALDKGRAQTGSQVVPQVSTLAVNHHWMAVHPVLLPSLSTLALNHPSGLEPSLTGCPLWP